MLHYGKKHKKPNITLNHERSEKLMNSLPYKPVISKHLEETSSHTRNSSVGNILCSTENITRTEEDTREKFVKQLLKATHNSTETNKSEFPIEKTTADFLNSHVHVTMEEAVKIALIQQSTLQQKHARQFCITGTLFAKIVRSRNLQKTLESELKHKDIQTAAMKYGIEADVARNYLQAEIKENILTTGLIISQTENFFAYTPDGITEASHLLVEIKCPHVCKTTSVKSEIGKKIKYLEMNGDSEVFLKFKDSRGYFSQIQFGMYVLNLTECIFLIYSPVGSELTRVQRDDGFMNEFIPKAKKYYFNHFIPFMKTTTI